MALADQELLQAHGQPMEEEPAGVVPIDRIAAVGGIEVAHPADGSIHLTQEFKLARLLRDAVIAFIRKMFDRLIADQYIVMPAELGGRTVDRARRSEARLYSRV